MLYADNFIGIQPLCGNYNKDISLIDIKKLTLKLINLLTGIINFNQSCSFK